MNENTTNEKQAVNHSVKKHNILFYGGWIALAGYCILTNLHHYFLGKYGLEGYSGSGIVNVLTAIFLLIFAVSFPFGIFLKFQRKPFASWLGMMLLGSFVMSVSDTFGIQNPYVDDPHLYDAVRFVDNWAAWTTLFTVVYIFPVIFSYWRIRCRKKISADVSSVAKIIWRIAAVFLMLLIAALITAGFLISHT